MLSSAKSALPNLHLCLRVHFLPNIHCLTVRDQHQPTSHYEFKMVDSGWVYAQDLALLGCDCDLTHLSILQEKVRGAEMVAGCASERDAAFLIQLCCAKEYICLFSL